MQNTKTLVMIFAFTLGMTARAFGLFGFGIHAGKDLFTVDSLADTFSLDYTLGTSTNKAQAAIERSAIEKPLMLGGQIYVDALPVIDIEVGFDIAAAVYNVFAWRQITVNNATQTDTLYNEKLPFARVGIYPTIKINLIKLPPIIHVVRVYAGAGLSFHLVTPVASPNLILDNFTTDQPKTLTVEEIVKKNTKTGGHLLAGVKIKPPLVPIALNVEAKFSIIPEGTYDEPSKFLSLGGGLSLNF